jgi:hypothetical protein
MMRKRILFLAGMSLFILSAVFLFGLTPEEKKGLVTYADGQVKKSVTVEETWLNAPVNTEVLSGDRVRTYRESRAELNFAQLDVIRLAPKTTIHISKLYEENKEKKIQTAINIEEGELWAAVHQVEATTDFDISAPIAAAAITGTVLRMKVGEDTTTQLKVYEGEVKIRNKPQTLVPQTRSLVPHEVPGPYQIPGPQEVTVEEWFFIIQAMQQITIDKKGTVVSKGDFSNADAEEQSDWVKWNQERDQERK